MLMEINCLPRERYSDLLSLKSALHKGPYQLVVMEVSYNKEVTHYAWLLCQPL